MVKLFNSECKILVIGCGNSKMSEEMYDDGFTNLTNIDISQVVIDQMKVRNEERPSMQWIKMDVTEMTFENESFDIVLDKSTIDTLL